MVGTVAAAPGCWGRRSDHTLDTRCKGRLCRGRDTKRPRNNARTQACVCACVCFVVKKAW